MKHENRDLKITICQTDITWGDTAINTDEAIALITNSEHSDLFVFPEMFSTGFTMKPKPLAETNNGITLSKLKETAKELHCGICGSFIAKESLDNYFNRFFLVSDSSLPFFYDKRHLFSMAGEDQVYKPGNTNIPVQFKGWNILPIICYDLRFPVWSRNTSEYDLMICPANWPIAREDAWVTLLKARAIENQCYVVGVNRTGEDPNGNIYGGRSLVFSPKGELLLDAGKEKGHHSITLSKDALINFRIKFPVLKDRDNYSII